MSDVDPFAGITAGRLEGIDLDTDEIAEDHGPAYAPMQPEVIPGSLGGEGETSDDEELQGRAEAELERINEELDASMAAALEAESFDEQPGDEPDEDFTSRRVQELKLVGDPPPATSGRPRGRPPTGVEPPKGALITYLIFGEGQLDDGRPYWFVASEVEAKNYDEALYKSWVSAGKQVEGLSVHIERKDSWEPRVLEIELVPRATARKLVVRQ